MVAKLAYLAKRARPECLCAVAYLVTRVTKCTTDDVEKLKRVVKYISGTKERGVILRPRKLGGEGGGVQLHFDTAYGVHTDGKSQTGSYVVIGDVEAVHCKSCKQNIVTKSSTEVELIAMYIKDPPYIHQILLAARASGNEGSNGSAQKDEGNVRERTHQATAGVAVRVRKRMPYGMGVIIYHSHV